MLLVDKLNMLFSTALYYSIINEAVKYNLIF